MRKGRAKLTAREAPVKKDKKLTKLDEVPEKEKTESLRVKLTAVLSTVKLTHPAVWIALTLIFVGLLTYLIVIVCSVDWAAGQKVEKPSASPATMKTTLLKTSETFKLQSSMTSLWERMKSTTNLLTKQSVLECNLLLCNNQGDCKRRIDTRELYCSCTGGYRGTSCEVEPVIVPSRCISLANPCSDNGRCIDLAQGEHICTCYDGYNTTDCVENIDECYSGTCYHGNCTDLINKYTCDCALGFEGKQCQTDLNDCSTKPCPTNSTCIDLINNYTCLCDVGYTGIDCHSLCDDEPCYNNATCSLCDGGVCDGTRLPFKCNCTKNGTYGALCTDSDGYWSSWSQWAKTPDMSIEVLISGTFSAPVANCSYLNTTRTRQCNQHLAFGAQCEGPSLEEAALQSQEVECECLLCCEGNLRCGPVHKKACYCNEECASSGRCCNNSDFVCSNTTIVTVSDLT